MICARTEERVLMVETGVSHVTVLRITQDLDVTSVSCQVFVAENNALLNATECLGYLTNINKRYECKRVPDQQQGNRI